MIDNVSYESLKNTVIDWLKSNCKNITDYSNIEPCFKNGSTIQVANVVNGTEGPMYKENVYYTIQSPLTGPTAANVVDSDMNSFYTSIGSPNGNIPEDQFYNYINDLACFCATKLAFITSQDITCKKDTNYTPPSDREGMDRYIVDTNMIKKYLIYFPSNNSFVEKKNILPSSAVSYLIKAEDVNMLWKNIIDMMIRINGCIRVLKVTGTMGITKNH